MLKEDYQNDLYNTFLMLEGPIHQVEGLYKTFKNLEENYTRNKIELIREHDPSLLKEKGGITQGSLINVILRPLMPANQKIDDVIKERLQYLRRTNPVAGSSRAPATSFGSPVMSSPAEMNIRRNVTVSPAYRKPRVAKFPRTPTNARDLTSEDVLHMLDDLCMPPAPNKVVPLLPIFSLDRCVVAAEIPTSEINCFDKSEIEKALIEVGGFFDSTKIKTNFLSLDE